MNVRNHGVYETNTLALAPWAEWLVPARHLIVVVVATVEGKDTMQDQATVVAEVEVTAEEQVTLVEEAIVVEEATVVEEAKAEVMVIMEGMLHKPASTMIKEDILLDSPANETSTNRYFYLRVNHVTIDFDCRSGLESKDEASESEEEVRANRS